MLLSRSMSIQNVHLITGASSGIGSALARILAKKKLPLALWARRTERLEVLKKECLDLGAPEVKIATLDVRDKQAIHAELQNHRNFYDRTLALINNAGLARGRELFHEGKSLDWEEMIDINLKGVLFVTEAILPLMLQNKRGDILMVGSVAGHTTYPGGNVYAATKAAIDSLTKSLRMDLLGQPIRVMEIAPGATETEFSLTRYRGDTVKAKAVYDGMKPLSAHDVASSMDWMLSTPRHVTLSHVVIYPTDQAHPLAIHRRT